MISHSQSKPFSGLCIAGLAEFLFIKKTIANINTSLCNILLSDYFTMHRDHFAMYYEFTGLIYALTNCNVFKK